MSRGYGGGGGGGRLMRLPIVMNTQNVIILHFANMTTVYVVLQGVTN